MDERIEVKPGDLPSGSMVQLTTDGDHWVAEFFPEQHSRLTTGGGEGATVGEAIREALDEAGE